MLKQKEPVPPGLSLPGLTAKCRRHEFFEISIFKIEDPVKKKTMPVRNQAFFPKEIDFCPTVGYFIKNTPQKGHGHLEAHAAKKRSVYLYYQLLLITQQ